MTCGVANETSFYSVATKFSRLVAKQHRCKIGAMDASAEMRVCDGSDASTRERLLFFIVTFLPRGAKQILGFEEA